MSMNKERLQVHQSPASVAYYTFCLAGNKHAQIPITGGQAYSILAQAADRCSPPGWSWDNGKDWVDPGGSTQFAADAMLPAAPLGALVGAISDQDGGQSTGESLMLTIFKAGFFVGLGTNGRSQYPAGINGWLYLLMNDNWTLGDDIGSVWVQVWIG